MDHFDKGFSFAEILAQTQFYDSTLENLEFKEDQPKSAVALIVRRSRNENIEKNKDDFIHDQILFLQRKKSSKDRFSGQICLPGGRQQPNQTILEAAIRETYEQTNIKLSRKNLIGCINRQVNFIISTKKQSPTHKTKQVQSQSKKKQMVVYAFVFSVNKDEIMDSNIKLNQNQMSDYKWVPAIQFMKPTNVCWLDYSQKLRSLARVYHYDSNVEKNSESALRFVKKTLSPAINVKMNEKIYGVTLYIMMIVLVSFSKKMESLLMLDKKSYSQKKKYSIRELLMNLQQIKALCQGYMFFQLKDDQPIDDNFRVFEKALREGMYRMRPKL